MYKSVALKEFYEDGSYWHLDMNIHGLAGSSIMSAVRFKVFGLDDGYGLEFRHYEGWPRAFEQWPGREADSYGEYYRIHANVPVDQSVLARRDAAMLRSLAAALPRAVAEATAGLADRADWREAANLVAATILGEPGHPGAAAPAPAVESDASPAEAIPEPAAIETPVADHVREVIAALGTVHLTRLKTSFRALPDRWTPIVVCVVKNDRTILPDFLRHYRAAGVERFCFIDGGSTDGTRSYLLAQPDADIFEHGSDVSPIEEMAGINHAIRQYGPDRWFIHADADEHIVFQDMATHAFGDLTRTMQYLGIDRVRGVVIDMYADRALSRPAYMVPARLNEAYPFFDSNTYMEERKKEFISVRGGPRARLFGGADTSFSAEMTKYPLFLSQGESVLANPHHHWPIEQNFASDRYLGILHYSFLHDMSEDRRTQSAIAAKPDICVMGEMSALYSGPASLVSFGLIRQIPWRESNHLAAIYNAAFRRRRAELECDHGALSLAAELPAS